MTTPTGIRIERCGTCGHEHPVTRQHCTGCGIASVFLDPAGHCRSCR